MWVPPHSEDSDKEIKMPLSGREDQNHKLKLNDRRTEKKEIFRVSECKVSEIRVHSKEGTKKIVLDAGVPEEHLSRDLAVQQVNSSHEIGMSCQNDNDTQRECPQIQEHIKAQQEHERVETRKEENPPVSAKDKDHLGTQEKRTLEECKTLIKRTITGNRHTKWIQRQWGKHCGKLTGSKDTIIGNPARKFPNPRVERDDSQSSGSTDRSQCSSRSEQTTTKCLPLAYSFISFKTGISTVNCKTQFLPADCIQIWRNWRSSKTLQPPNDRSGNPSQVVGHKLQTVNEEKEDSKLHRVDQGNDKLHIVDDGNDGSTLPVLDKGNDGPKPNSLDGGNDVSKLDALSEGNELHNVDEGNEGFKLENVMPNPARSATESLDAPSSLLTTLVLQRPKQEPEVIGSATITALQVLTSDCKQAGEHLTLSNEINIFKDIMKGSPRRNHGLPLPLRTTAEVTKYLGELIHKICSAEAGCNIKAISSRSEDTKLLQEVDGDDKTNDDKSLKLDSRVAEAIQDHPLVLHSTKPLSPYRVLFEEKNKAFLHEILASLSEEAQLIKQAWNYSLKHTSIFKGNQDKPNVVNDAGKIVKENDNLSLFLSLKDGKIQMKDKQHPQKERLQNDKLKKPEITTEFYIKINQEELLKKLPSKPNAPPKVRYHSVKEHLSRLPGGDVGIIALDNQPWSKRGIA